MAEQYRWQTYPYFGGGLNNAQPASDIEDDECAEILNFEFDLSDNLKARNGFIRQNTGTDFSSRLTSIFNFFTVAGVENIIVTSGNDCFKHAGVGVYTSIKGAVALPTNTYWQWAAFTDLAIGVNQQLGGAEKGIVKWTGAGNLAALALTGIAGAPDGAHSILSWNSRLWVVFSTKPNRLYFSSLGNPEDWATTGGFLEINYDDGDRIVGLGESRGKLFIFKRRRIYVLSTSVGGVINTDPDGWNVDRLTSNMGCISRYTIQNILDDLLFLTDDGIASIKAVQEYGDFKTQIISRKVEELSNLNTGIDTYSSVVDHSKSLYFLAAPKLTTGTINNRLYVLDYKKIRFTTPAVISPILQNLRWTIFESSIINPSVLGSVIFNGSRTVFLGGDTPLFYLCYHDQTTEFSDTGIPVTKMFRSKAFASNQLERIEVNKIAIKIGFTNLDFSGTIEVRFNENDALRDSFSISLLNNLAQSLWDSAIWDVDSFSLNATNTQVVERKLKDFRRGISAQIKFTNTQLNQDVVVQDLGFQIGQLTIENA
jgi:hypothetical protein